MSKGLVVLAVMAWASVSLGGEAATGLECAPWAAKLVSSQGQVAIKRVGEEIWRPAGIGDVLCDGGTIRVAGQSRAAVRLPSETILRLDQDTTLTFTATARSEKALLELLRGAIHAITRIPRLLEVYTPFVNAAVEGTEFLARTTEEEAQITVFEGRVRLENAIGELRLAQGESGTARAGQPPVTRLVVNPLEAVTWAIYYPPVVDLSRNDGPEPIRKAAARFAAGDVTGALAATAGPPPSTPDANFFTYRASLLLFVGRVDEAEQAIVRAMDIAPDHGVALALKSIVALSQNQIDVAQKLAQEAVKSAPDKAAPHIALSYVKQARFDLDSALRQAEAAVGRAPQDALAHARVAELQLAQGDLRAAKAAADIALRLNPNLARTQTVLGFAYLLQLRPAQAREHFEQAIARNSADPLPRLGLGLAYIRRGRLTEGRESIEIAAGLDPTESLVRSYLGKAYFEERRGEIAASQYAMAKELDPQDPTPWFYNAILMQTSNRPVEALEDMQEAIKRNHNRAVYRSRLALDTDLAARSASQAQIYSDLGFGQRALLEGARGLWTDPSEFAAHRFLADAYRVLPRHEIARTSELLQAQLLQPLNVNPLQPQLVESNLGVFQGAGPTTAGANEFNPLFVSDGFRAQANAYGAGNDTLANDLVVAGLKERVSLSVGQYAFDTDGWRENSDKEDSIYNAFFQVALVPSTSIQVEARKRDLEQGDRKLRLIELPSPGTLKEDLTTESLRLGLRHSFGLQSDMLVSVIARDDDFDISIPGTDPSFPFSVDTSEAQRGRMIEVQNITRLERWNLISGVGYQESDIERLTVTSFPTAPEFNKISPFEDTPRSGNAYIYANWQLSTQMLLTLGASVVGVEDAFRDETTLNPKVGLVWSPLAGSTIRAAAFETPGRNLVGTQTLEPTQIAGFNQFFQDADSDIAVDAKRYGLAIDQQFDARLYGGLEISARDLDVPLPDPKTEGEHEVTRVDWDESAARAYLYWALSPSLAMRADLLREHFEREWLPRTRDKFTELTTWRAPLAISWFGRSGLTAGVTATYVDQEGTFLVPGGEIEADDEFWVVDAEVSYRLPRRYGLVALGALNLTDESFRFEEVDRSNPSFYPERLIYGKLVLSF